MLLEFKTTNYKSFADEMTFSMIPAPKQKGLDYSIQSVKVGRKVFKGLCSAVIYGPNASGKTNVIGAMDTMKAIMLRGNIRNSDSPYSPNQASNVLELVPNCDLKEKPVSFSIKFAEKGLIISYSFTAMLGNFLDVRHDREIIDEQLTVNEKCVFSRNTGLTIEIPSALNEYLNDGIKQVTQPIQQISESSLNKEELFLNNGFKTVFSQKLVSLILNWIDNKFIVIYRSDAIRTMRKFANPKANTVYVEKTLTEASKMFGISSNALGYKVIEDRNDDAVLCSIFDGIDGKKMAIPAEHFESFGTIRFVNEFPLVIKSLLNGATLVMDEFDASIHPMALMSIINIFHNDEINKNCAQLIFNTHNPIFLNSGLFRRDEIKFVERDEETNHSIHYALSDFKTADGTRKGEDYMNNYFVSKYGAIRDIDFSPLFENIMNEKQELQ